MDDDDPQAVADRLASILERRPSTEAFEHVMDHVRSSESAWPRTLSFALEEAVARHRNKAEAAGWCLDYAIALRQLGEGGTDQRFVREWIDRAKALRNDTDDDPLDQALWLLHRAVAEHAGLDDEASANVLLREALRLAEGALGQADIEAAYSEHQMSFRGVRGEAIPKIA
jgi:hypothetical protein